MGPHPAAAETFLVVALLSELLCDREAPRVLSFFSLQPTAWLIAQPQRFPPLTEVGLPSVRERLKSGQSTAAAAMNPCADQGHLQIEGVEQGIPLPFRHQASLSPELGPLSQQTAVPAHQIGINRFKLKHDPIQPLASESRFASHQEKIQGTEANAAQRTDQIELTSKGFPVASGLPSSPAPEVQFKGIVITGSRLENRLIRIPVDQIMVLTGPVGAETSKQLDGLEQIRFADTIATDHQQPGRLDLQLQMAVIAKALQFQLEKLNRSRCGVWLRYLHRSSLWGNFMQRRQPVWACSSVG